MKYITLGLFVALLAVGGISGQALWTGTPVNLPLASAITTTTGLGCTAPASGVTNYCRTGAGEQISCNGAAYIPGDVCTPLAGALKTVNGVKPGANGNVTVQCPNASTPATPALFSGSTSLAVTVPAMTATIPSCVGTGS
jgi:hypothetical protein